MISKLFTLDSIKAYIIYYSISNYIVSN